MVAHVADDDGHIRLVHDASVAAAGVRAWDHARSVPANEVGLDLGHDDLGSAGVVEQRREREAEAEPADEDRHARRLGLRRRVARRDGVERGGRQHPL
jgi:hypothetical protein